MDGDSGEGGEVEVGEEVICMEERFGRKCRDY